MMRTSTRSLPVTAPHPRNAAAMRATSARATSSLDCGGQSSTRVGGDEMNGVAVAAHDAGRRRNIVGDDPVAALAGELRLGVGDDVVGLGRKAYDQPRPAGLAMRDGGEDVGVLHEFDGRRPAMLLDLAAALICCGRQSATAAAKTATSAGSAFSTAASISRAVSTCTTDTPGGSGRLTGPLTSITSAPAAAAAAAMAWPCLPDERLASTRTGSSGSLVGPDVTRTRLPASRPSLRSSASAAAAISSGSAMRPMPASPRSAISPAFGPMNCNAVRAQLRQIALRRLRRPHMRVHRRREQDRLVGRKQHRGRQIVRLPGCHFGDQIRGRRRDDDQIGLARHADMADIEFALRIEQIGVGALAGERAGRERRDEMRRRRRENAAHARAAILQTPDQVERFVGRDAAADDEQDAFLHDRVGARLPRRWLRRRIRRIDQVERLAPGFLRRLPENDAHLVLHGAAMAGGAQPQQLLQLLIELPDGQARHRRSSGERQALSHGIDCIAINAIIAAGG